MFNAVLAKVITTLPALSGAAGVFTYAFVYQYEQQAEASAAALHPPHYPWQWLGRLEYFDKASVKRGFQVYQEVCSSCHGLEFVRYRHLVDVTHPVDQVKLLAAEKDLKLADRMPGPYASEEEAMEMNGGAIPPDLSLITYARHQGNDYVFSLLTSYHEAPAGIQTGALHYNPYFPGTLLAMEKPLMDGKIEYWDGTPATVSQMAKDVTTFLAWAAEKELDTKHLQGAKILSGLMISAALTGYFKRWMFNPLKSRRVYYVPNKKVGSVF